MNKYLEYFCFCFYFENKKEQVELKDIVEVFTIEKKEKVEVFTVEDDFEIVEDKQIINTNITIDENYII
jgi:hypothetical protein